MDRERAGWHFNRTQQITLQIDSIYTHLGGEESALCYEVATMVKKNWHQIFHASIFIFPTCHFQYRTHCTDAVTRGRGGVRGRNCGLPWPRWRERRDGEGGVESVAAASRQRRIYLNLEAVASDLFGVGGGKGEGRSRQPTG